MTLRREFRSVALLTLLLMAVGLVLPVAAVAAPRGAAASPPASMSQDPEASAPVQDPEDAHALEAADEHAAEEVHEAEAKAWWYWPSKWINFIALCALLYWMIVYPPVAIQEIFSFAGLHTIFIDRSAAILAARDLATEQKSEAVQVLSDSETRLAKIEEEVAALVAEARDDAVVEQARALKDGKAQVQKIHEVAQREVGHERVAAQRQLRSFVADLAVSLAQTNLAEHLTADDQDRLIRDYLSRLGQSMA